MLAYVNDPAPSRRCLLPWILLVLVLVALAATAWWGYNKREEVARYAVSALLEQHLGKMLPPDADASQVAVRLAALMRAVEEGRIDPARLAGMGELMREYYADRHLDANEFESLLAFAEAAVEN